MKKFPLFFAFVLFVGSVFSSNCLFAGSKKDKALKAKNAVIKLLKLSGNNASKKFKTSPWPGSTTQGFDIQVPGTDLKICSFFTRTKGTPVWHVGIILDMDKDKANASLLTNTYTQLSSVFGGIQLKSLILVVSEDSGTMKLSDLGKDISKPLSNFTDSDRILRDRPQVTFAPGVNFFATVKPPETGVFKTIEKLILVGGKTDGDLLMVNGSLNSNILNKILGNQTTAGKTPSMDGVAIKVVFPSVVPMPFSLFDAKESKKLVYTRLSKSAIWFEWDKKEKELTIGGNRTIDTWLFNKQFQISDAIQIVKKKNANNSSGRKKTEWTLLNKAEIDVSTATIPLLKPFESFFKINKLFVSSIIKDSNKSATSNSKNGKGSRKTSISMLVGAKLKLGGINNLESYIQFGIENKKGKNRINSLGFSITGDIAFSKIPLLNIVPILKEFVLNEVTVGLNLHAKGMPDLYLAGAMKWKKITGQAALMVVMKKGKPDVLFISKVENFAIGSFFEGYSNPIVPQTTMNNLAKVLNIFKLPNAVFMLSSIPEKTIKKEPFLLEDLPLRMQQLFDGIVTDTKGKIPLYGDGIALISAIDVTGVNELIKIKPLQKVFKDMGVAENMRSMAVDSSLILGATIGGLRSGSLKFGVFADLPKLHFPEMLKPISYLVQPQAGKARFFMRFDSTSLAFQAGVEGILELKIPQIGDESDTDDMTLGGDIFVNLDLISAGIQGSVFKKGKWRNPFGLGNIALTDTAFTIGVDSNKSLELGFGGGYEVTIPNGKINFNMPKLSVDTSNKSIKAMLSGANAKNIEKAIAEANISEAKKYFKEGVGGFIGLTWGGNYVVPSKLAIYMQASEIGNPLTTIEVEEALFKGVLTGPAAKEILKQSKKIIGMAHNAGANKTIEIMDKVRDLYSKTPSLVQLLHLNDFPLGLIVYKDVLLYFVTPGASVPGFPEINGIGFKVMGKAEFKFFGTHNLGAIDFRLTLSDGLKIYAELGNIDLPGFKTRNTKLDIHIGIPGIMEGEDLPHFYLTGDLECLFIKKHVAMKFSNEKGIVFELEDNYGPFGKAVFKFASVLRKGKKLVDKDGLIDFRLDAQLQKKAVNEALKKLIVDDMLKDVSNKLKSAKNILNSAKSKVRNLNKRVRIAREQVKQTISASRQEAIKTAENSIRTFKRQRNELAKKRDSIIHGSWNKKLKDGWKVPVLETQINALSISIKTAETTLRACKATAKLDIPVDANPIVAALLPLQKAAVVAMNAADVWVRTLEKLNNKIRQQTAKILSKIKDVLVINNLQLRSDGLLHMNKNPLFFDVDIKLKNKPIKYSTKIKEPKNAVKSATDCLKSLATKIMSEGLLAECATIKDNLTTECAKEASKEPFGYKNDEYQLPPGGLAKLSPLDLQKLFHTDQSNIGIPRGSKLYLMTIGCRKKGNYLTQVSKNEIRSTKIPSQFIFVDINGHDLNYGDRIAIIAPNNRYVNVNNKAGLVPDAFSARIKRAPGSGASIIISNACKFVFVDPNNVKSKAKFNYKSDSWFALKSVYKCRYVKAYKGGGAYINATFRAIKGWCYFKAITCKPLGAVTIQSETQNPWLRFSKPRTKKIINNKEDPMNFGALL